jgi:hypothetical protein
MSVDLNLYLLKSDVTQIDDVIPEEKRGPHNFERVQVRQGFVSDGACHAG